VNPSPSHRCTRRNPRTIPSSSAIVAAFILEGVAWYAAHRIEKSMVGIMLRTKRLRDIFVFVDPLACVEAPIISPCDFYINIAGRSSASIWGNDSATVFNDFKEGFHAKSL
jgi:hypothetical protein